LYLVDLISLLNFLQCTVLGPLPGPSFIWTLFRLALTKSGGTLAAEIYFGRLVGELGNHLHRVYDTCKGRKAKLGISIKC
jgi:hypothetical protein